MAEALREKISQESSCVAATQSELEKAHGENLKLTSDVESLR